MLLICISNQNINLDDILDKKTTGIASWASYSCTTSDKITGGNTIWRDIRCTLEFTFNFNLSLFIINLLGVCVKLYGHTVCNEACG